MMRYIYICIYIYIYTYIYIYINYFYLVPRTNDLLFFCMARNGHHLVKQLFLLDEEIEETMTGPLVVTDFETEKNHDILTVNGKAAGH